MCEFGVGRPFCGLRAACFVCALRFAPFPFDQDKGSEPVVRRHPPYCTLGGRAARARPWSTSKGIDHGLFGRPGAGPPNVPKRGGSANNRDVAFRVGRNCFFSVFARKGLRQRRNCFFHQKGFAATEKRQDMHGNLFEILPSFSFVLPRSPPYWA